MPIRGEYRYEYRIFNAIVAHLQEEQLGFNLADAKVSGKDMISMLSQVRMSECQNIRDLGAMARRLERCLGMKPALQFLYSPALLLPQALQYILPFDDALPEPLRTSGRTHP